MMKRSLACLLFALTPALANASDGNALGFFTVAPTEANNGAPLSFVAAPENAPEKPELKPADDAKPPRALRSLGTASADVAKLAEQMGVPQALALAVCRVESHCRYGVSGPGGVHGPLQIKHQTARGLGFNGSAGALRGYDGAYYGMKHLAAAYRKCGNAAGAAKLHQAGLRASCGRSGYSAKVAAFM
jgi:soluble lytic murein transglycosylase-like protein